MPSPSPDQRDPEHQRMPTLDFGPHCGRFNGIVRDVVQGTEYVFDFPNGHSIAVTEYDLDVARRYTVDGRDGIQLIWPSDMAEERGLWYPEPHSFRSDEVDIYRLFPKLFDAVSELPHHYGALDASFDGAERKRVVEYPDLDSLKIGVQLSMLAGALKRHLQGDGVQSLESMERFESLTDRLFTMKGGASFSEHMLAWNELAGHARQLGISAVEMGVALEHIGVPSGFVTRVKRAIARQG